jgi:hypothetical protein
MEVKTRTAGIELWTVHPAGGYLLINNVQSYEVFTVNSK